MENKIELIKVNKVGQINVGDMLYIDTCYGLFHVTAKLVLFKNETKEEVVIHKKKNHYFILSMLLDGSSWVKSVHILRHRKKYIRYVKGNVKNL